MAVSEREQRLQFLGLTERDEQLLMALRPLFEKHVGAVEDAFYDHLLRFPETGRLLRDQTTVERLKQLQRDYLLRIVAGNYDEAYRADRLRIGRTHERVGLPPHWYLLAYDFYFALFTPLIREYYADDPRRAEESTLALHKIFMFDASLAMEAYIASDRYRHLRQLESIVNDSADVIFMLDQDKRFRAWNRAAERIFGWKAAEIIGQHVNLIVPPELVKAGELVRIDAEVERHGSWHQETVRQARDGRRVVVELTVSLLRDPQGNPLGRSVILRDVTERARLAEARLQAERLAVIGAMAARLAHEIRNPLSSITLNLELVRDEVETLARPTTGATDEARSLLQSIHSEVRRIQRVTEDYLHFARMPKLHRERISLNEILTHGLAFMDSLFQASGVTVRTEFDPTLPLSLVDENQLWQAVLNLIRNALEAMPKQGTLTLRTDHDDHDVRLTISDTGQGMTDAERHEIFKPFFSTKVGGTGLGLPLTQQVIGEHGGRIECESAVGQGTTFIIYLPRHPEA